MRSQFFRTIIFALSALFLASARGVDVKRFELVKGIHYYQIGEGSAILQTNNAYRFTVQVNADVVGDVLGSSVYTPKIPRIDLIADKDGDPFRFRDKFDDSFGLENNYPNGTYQLGIRGLHDGDHTMSFAIAGNSYPAAPVINDYTGLQNLVYNQYNDISWQPFAGGTTNDYIQLQIEDLLGHNIWQTSDFAENGALNGLDTHTLLPPGTLSPGAVYVGTLQFFKNLYSASRDYPGARGTVGYYTRTEFTIRPKSVGLTPVVDRLQIWRTLRYEQLISGVFRAEDYPWEFSTQLDTVSSNQLVDVKVRVPGRAESVGLLESDPTQFAASEAFLTNKSAFLEIYPDGAYSYDLTRPDSTRQTYTVNVPAGDFVAPPVLHDPESIQYQNHPFGQDLTVEWDPWTTGAEPDFIRVELEDGGSKIWDTSSFTSVKHLTPDVTSVTIPGTNFIAGHSMKLDVHFYHVNFADTAVIPGAMTFGGFETRTRIRFTNQLSDVTAFGVAEGKYVWQHGEGDYQADPNVPFSFDATVTAAAFGSVKSGALDIPSRGTLGVPADAASGQNLRMFIPEPSAQLLTQLYPPGDYQFHFDTAHDGVRTSTITVDSGDFPPIPHLTNFVKLGTFGTGTTNYIGWEPWGNDKTNHVLFSLRSLSGAPVIPKSGSGSDFIDVNTNMFEIDPGTLSDNQSYVGRIRFENRSHVENSSYPGARGTASVFTEVSFYVTTLIASNFKFLPRAPLMLPSGDISMTIQNLLPPRSYNLLVSDDLRNWTTVTNLIFKTNKVTSLTLTNTPSLERGFFRMELLP
jgi:hypothetical protein